MCLLDHQGKHKKCNAESRCRTQTDYVPTKRLIKSTPAKDALLKTIKATNIYKNAEDFSTVSIAVIHFQISFLNSGCCVRQAIDYYFHFSVP